MTAKTLSWTTFGLLTIGAFPFVANPGVASAVSSDDLPNRQSYSGTILPACGACATANEQWWQTSYAVDLNTLCTTPTAYRLTVRTNTKVTCDHGSYWVCDDSSSMACSAYIQRPACPQDSCKRT